MSAPNEGRQSPEPERQTGEQLNDAQADTSDVGGDSKSKDSGHNQPEKLASNPEHPLAKASEEKTSKK